MKTFKIAIIAIVALLAIVLTGVVIYAAVAQITFNTSFSKEYYDDLYVDIPGTDQQLLIKEWRFLLGSGEEVYYIPSQGAKPVFIGNLTGGDDGYCAFNKGKYSISYEDGIVTLKWSMRGEDEYLKNESFDLTAYVENKGMK